MNELNPRYLLRMQLFVAILYSPALLIAFYLYNKMAEKEYLLLQKNMAGILAVHYHVGTRSVRYYCIFLQNITIKAP